MVAHIPPWHRIALRNHAARQREAEARLIAAMIRQGRSSDEIAAAVGVKEHFILGEMKARAAIARAEGGK